MDSITVSGLQSGDTITINGRLGTVTLNGADATVEIRGSYKSIVNNLTGSPTVNIDGAWKGSDIADTKVVTDQLTAADAEPTGAPAVNETLLVKIAYMFAALRNKIIVTKSTGKKQFFDDADAAMWEKDASDDGDTYTETKGNAP